MNVKSTQEGADVVAGRLDRYSEVCEYRIGAEAVGKQAENLRLPWRQGLIVAKP
jgi:hypothetical protein